VNRAIPGVNTGFIARPKLLEEHLRSRPQAISRALFADFGPSLADVRALQDWLGRRAMRNNGFGRPPGIPALRR
jgi:hypothetical protein